MKSIDLWIDTNFGLSNFDYINSSVYEINTHNKLISNLDNEIKKRFYQKVKESRMNPITTWSERNNDGLLTEDILSRTHMYLSDELGPDQSYLGGKRGENNSIEIYSKILKAMWNDYIPRDVLYKRLIIKKVFNKQYKKVIKEIFNRWKDNSNKININTTIGKGIRVFISSIIN